MGASRETPPRGNNNKEHKCPRPLPSRPPTRRRHLLVVVRAHNMQSLHEESESTMPSLTSHWDPRAIFKQRRSATRAKRRSNRAAGRCTPWQSNNAHNFPSCSSPRLRADVLSRRSRSRDRNSRHINAASSSSSRLGCRVGYPGRGPGAASQPTPRRRRPKPSPWRPVGMLQQVALTPRMHG